MSLVPINGSVLIELADQYEGVTTPDKEFSTKTSGYMRAPQQNATFLDKNDYQVLLNKRVWFDSYKDDIKIERDGKTYTFVKFEDIRGYEV